MPRDALGRAILRKADFTAGPIINSRASYYTHRELLRAERRTGVHSKHLRWAGTYGYFFAWPATRFTHGAKKRVPPARRPLAPTAEKTQGYRPAIIIATLCPDLPSPTANH